MEGTDIKVSQEINDDVVGRIHVCPSACNYKQHHYAALPL